MADFIKLTKLGTMTYQDGSLLEFPFWVSKYHLTYMDDTIKHGVTEIIYDGKEYQVKESINEIIRLFSE